MTDLRTLAEAATPGPWHVEELGLDFAVFAGDPMVKSPTAFLVALFGRHDPNAAFIAAASPAVVLALLDVVDAARVLVQHGDCRADDDTHALRAALARVEEVTDAS